MSAAEIQLTDDEWKRITEACRDVPNEARPWISSVIYIYRRLPEYKNLEWRYEKAAILARDTAELIKRIGQYRSDADVPESLRPQWQKDVEGLDKLVDVLVLWTGRFQETAKRGKLELAVSRDAVRTLVQYLGPILELFMGRELDRSKEVERFVATVLKVADPGMKKNIGWQIRRAIEEWRLLQQGLGMSDDEYLQNLGRDPRFQESIKQLIPDLDTQK
jgi:hypothetical protein